MPIEDNTFLTIVTFSIGCGIFLASLLYPIGNFLLLTVLAGAGFVLMIPGVLKMLQIVDDRIQSSRNARK